MKKILISNDDGVHALGLNVLKEVLCETADVTVVAPQEERSTTGHTLTVDNVLRVEEVSPNAYGCSGYPADCSLMGFGHILKDKRPDLIVSGINRGGNLGQDIYYSGTVAAAREATFHGIPSIAVSLDVDFNARTEVFHYETAARFIQKVLSLDVEKHIDPYTLLNINVPNVPAEQVLGHEITYTGFRHYTEDIVSRTDSRGREYFWIGGKYQGFDKSLEGSDCDVVDKNKISITPLDLLNRYDCLKQKWREIFQAI